MAEATRTPQVGDPFRLDGFLYRLRGIERVVFGENKITEAKAIVVANPGLAAPGANRVSYDPNNPERLVQIRGFEQPPTDVPELEGRRKANVNYKLAGQCDQSELTWAEPIDYLDEVKVQGAARARGSPNDKARKWWDAWTAAYVGELESRLAKMSGAWMLPGRALIKQRPDSMDAFERADLKDAIAGFLTSTFDKVEG